VDRPARREADMEQTKWAACTRVEVAAEKHAIDQYNAATQQGFTTLQATLVQLTVGVQDIRAQDATIAREDASQAYLLYRLRIVKAHVSNLECTADAKDAFARQSYEPGLAVMPGGETCQQALDAAVDALLAASATLAKSTSSLQEILEALDEVVGTLNRACLPEEALACSEQVVDLARLLAGETDTLVAVAWLCRSLVDRSGLYVSVGQYQMALEAVTEALSHARRLCQRSDSPTFQDLLQQSLQLSAQCHVKRGLLLDARDQYAEVVELHRRRTAQATQESEEGACSLARALNNLGNLQTRMGQHAAAMATMQEVLAVTRRLYDLNPAVHGFRYALVLNNVTHDYLEAYQPEKALATITESVALRRAGAVQHPAVHRRSLASSLRPQSFALLFLGRTSEAFDSASEAVSILREVHKVQPRKIQRMLADALRGLAVMYHARAVSQTSLDLAAEAVHLWREITTEVLPEHQLAEFLETLAVAQAGLGQCRSALASVEEALCLYGEDSQNCRGRLSALYTAKLCYLESGKAQEADLVWAEATQIFFGQATQPLEALFWMRQHAMRYKNAGKLDSARLVELDVLALEAGPPSGGSRSAYSDSTPPLTSV
jgi:tetratricopeptide (TPR) repeat protein